MVAWRTPTGENPTSPQLAPTASVFRKLLPKRATDRLTAELNRSSAAENRARQLLQSGKLEEAETECRRAMALSPALNGKPWYRDTLQLLGEIKLAQGNTQEALSHFAEAGQGLQSPMLKLNTALALCRQGDLQSAKQICPDAEIAKYLKVEIAQREDWPGTGDPRSLEATILLVKGLDASYSVQLEEALLHLKAASKLAPKNWIIARVMGNVLLRLKRYKEAASYLLRAEQYGGKISYREHQLAHPEKYLGVPAKR